MISIKNLGKLVFSIIPEDLLLRTYYETKTENDLLNYMFDGEQFKKMKLTQVLFHVSILMLQTTSWNSTSKYLDDRIGLNINETCLATNKMTPGVLEGMISFLLVRQLVELVLYMLQEKRMINWRFNLRVMKHKLSINTLLIFNGLNIFAFGFSSLHFINTEKTLMNCQNQLRVNVMTDFIVSLLSYVICLFEQSPWAKMNDYA